MFARNFCQGVLVGVVVGVCGGLVGCGDQEEADSATPTPAGDTTYVFAVKGMTCEHMCVPKAKSAIEGVEGVATCTVSLAESRATVTCDGAKCSPDKIADAIAQAGFEAALLPEGASDPAATGDAAPGDDADPAGNVPPGDVP